MSLKVLIVEDDLMVAYLNQQFCGKHEKTMSVIVANDYEQAKKLLKYESFDLVLLDMFIPKGRGIDLLKHFHDKSKFILITADSSHQTLTEALSMGAIDYLLKPYSYERFCVAIDRFKLINHLNNEEEKISQTKIDSYFGVKQQEKSQSVTQLSKGLNTQTMGKVMEVIEGQQDFSSTQEVAEKLAISRISTKKYIDFLVDHQFLEETIVYLKKGRPVIKYKLKNEMKNQFKELWNSL